jgi:hypothetical protein
MDMKIRILLIIVFLFWPAVLMAGLAEALSSPAAVGQLRLSPDGKYVAMVNRREKYSYVSVGPPGGDGLLTSWVSDSERVEQLYWLNEQRLLLKLRRPGGSARFLSVERNGRAALALTPDHGLRNRQPDPVLVDSLTADRVHVLLAIQAGSRWALDVYRVNVYTGERRLLEANPGNTYRWLTDRDGRLRVRSDWSFERGRMAFRHSWRAQAESSWRPFYARICWVGRCWSRWFSCRTVVT